MNPSATPVFVYTEKILPIESISQGFTGWVYYHDLRNLTWMCSCRACCDIRLLFGMLLLTISNPAIGIMEHHTSSIVMWPVVKYLVNSGKSLPSLEVESYVQASIS